MLRLDANPEQAAEEYEELRRRLIRFFEWRGARFPDEHADEVLNRLARKLVEGVAVHSFFDFGLHTTVNAVVFMILVVIATVNVRGDESPVM